MCAEFPHKWEVKVPHAQPITSLNKLIATEMKNKVEYV